MVDFNKINPEQAQKIINALKDGKINANEAKQLGLSAQEAEALNKAFSSGEAQIGDFVLVNKGKSKDGKMQYSETKKMQQPKAEEQSWWDKTVAFAKDNAGALVSGALVVGGGALCLTGVGSGLGAAMIIAGAAMGLTSCSKEDDIPVGDINNSNNVEVNITIPKNDQTELINAFKEGIDALLAKMEELGYKVEKYGDKIIELLVENNSYLKGIATDLKEHGKKQDKILEILTNINSTVDTISSLVKDVNDNITVNGESIKSQLTAILNAIKGGQANTEAKLDIYMEQLKELLLNIIEQQGEHIEIDKDSNLTLNDILAKLDKMNGCSADEKLAAILEILGSIESIGKDINNKLDAIINKLENAFPDNTEIKASLDRIEQYLKENNNKTDVTNALLEKLLQKYQAGGLSEEDLQKILDAISRNGDKIDTTNKLLTQLGTDAAVYYAGILDAIKNISVSGGDTGNIEALLNKILAKMDNNTTKVLEAIANIKVTGGGVIDLSSIENMLKELIELTKNNGNVLSNIDAKMDILNVTTEAIYEKLGNVDQNVKNILEFVKNNAGNYDDTKLLEKLDKIMDKLDDILAAIKDHNVTVDITGKVTCECNCGGNHEGILGDLEDILG